MNNIFNTFLPVFILLFIGLFFQADATAETLEVRINANSDDADEHKNNGNINTNRDRLRPGTEIIGLRFNQVTIPSNATISNAYLQFTALNSNGPDTHLTIEGLADDSAEAFTTNSHNISNRTRTSASASWNPVDWNKNSEYNSSNLTNIIQEIVARGGWNSGNSMAFIITGTGKRVAYSYNKDANKAPLLHIEYTIPEPEPEPEPDAGSCSFKVRYIETDSNWNWINTYPAHAMQAISIPDSANHQISASIENNILTLNVNNINASPHTDFMIDADNDQSTGYADIFGAEYRIVDGGLHKYQGANGAWDWRSFIWVATTTLQTNPHSTSISIPLDQLPLLAAKCSNTDDDDDDDNSPASLTLTGTLRDFHDTHPDFEPETPGFGGNTNNYADLITGMVETTLGSDKKPVFNGSTKSTSTAANFNQWFRDVSGVNQSKSYSLTLEKQGNVYIYDSAVNPVGNSNSPAGFFPLDGQLFGNETIPDNFPSWYTDSYADNGHYGHNYHMTYEIHSQFTYQGGETFAFSGDDDVWVFINNQLVVDLGGIHAREEGEVDLDALGLTTGETYSFAMFWAERHVVGSNFKITTSIELEELTPDPDPEPESCTAIFEDDFESGLSNNWRTLKALGGFTPQVTNGRLRLTNRSHDLSTAVTLDYIFPSQNNTFVMEFDYYAYGGCSDGYNWIGYNDSGDWGGDGLSVILFDSLAGRSPRVGASGGSLGYANGNIELMDGSNEAQPGFEKGWFGIGIDEFGNFKTNDEGRRDLSGHTGSISDEDSEEPNTVAIRGSEIPANGESSGYRLLAASNTLNQALAQLQNSSYKSGHYRLTVDMSTAGLQYVTLERDTGSGYETLIGPFNALDGAYQQGLTPEHFRVAFSSGTGGACNNHEIDNVKICGEGEVYTPTNDPICWATTDDNNQIYRIDPRVGADSLPQSILIESDRILRAEGGSYRPSDGYIYKFDDDGESYGSHEDDIGPDSLYKINTTTGHVTLAAARLVPDHVDAAEFYINPETKEEIFYAIAEGDTLYAFDPETWQPLDGYPKDIIGNRSIGGLAINSQTGLAYVIDDYNWGGDAPKLYSFNLQTAQTTYLFALQGVIDAEGLAFADDGNLYVENDSGVGSSSTRNKIHRVNLNNGSLEEASYLTDLEGDIETLSCNGGASIAPPVDPPEDDPVFDFGDAPESYKVAFHKIPSSPTIYLGSVAPDDEAIDEDAYPYAIGATGDDADESDDEEGVQHNNADLQEQIFRLGQAYTFIVSTHGSGYLNAWIDWNKDGIFQNSEQISSGQDGSSGTIALSITIPADATLGSTYARFRYSSHESLLPAGPANDGEVEDYTFSITENGLVCSIDEATSGIYSTASVTVNSNRLNSNTRIYQTRFDSETWAGHLLSYDLETNDNDGNTKSQKWNAANLLGAYDEREIFTYNPETSGSLKGKAFWWDQLNNTQKTALKEGDVSDAIAQKRLRWIRGQQSEEKTASNSSGILRERTTLLGDIIHSSPVFAGQRENYGYSTLTGSEGSSYATFLTQKSTRQKSIYVGANDGMLHSFNADTGAELFAYIPNEVFPNLAKLSSPDYGCQEEDCIPHQYYVDGHSTLGDAYFGDAWHTVLLGTLGKGGKGIFALDVTDPASFSANKVMWEVSAAQDQAEIINTTSWHVYDNAPEGAVISTVNDTEKGQVTSLQGSGTSNGYRLGQHAGGSGAWNNTTQKTISWEMKYAEGYTVYITVNTTLGQRYIYYTASNSNNGKNNNYIHHGLGSDTTDGQWHTFTRDLVADLKEFEPDNNLLSVNGFLIRGSGLVGNIQLQVANRIDHMGYSIPEPSIVRMHDGSWAAIVSNGYNSDSNQAVLFLIDISNGHLIKTINTEVGSANTPNGLSSPIPVDIDGDRITDFIYAGDLLGNMWKFDVSDSDADNWSVAYSNSGTPAPLFITCETTAADCTKTQVITAKPQVGRHPAGGYMVYFGTGKYFDPADNVASLNPDIQTLYGIRDNGHAVTDRDDLVEQTILQESDVATDLKARVTSNNSIDYATKKGWFMKLVKPDTNAVDCVDSPDEESCGTDGIRQGERIISQALLRGGRLIVTTLIPPENCAWDGTSWIMELKALTGSRLSAPPLDLNNDKQFTNDDKVTYNEKPVSPSGIQKTSLGLILSPPEVINHTAAAEGKYVNGSSGAIGMFRESTGDTIGRQSWKQIR